MLFLHEAYTCQDSILPGPKALTEMSPKSSLQGTCEASSQVSLMRGGADLDGERDWVIGMIQAGGGLQGLQGLAQLLPESLWIQGKMPVGASLPVSMVVPPASLIHLNPTNHPCVLQGVGGFGVLGIGDS